MRLIAASLALLAGCDFEGTHTCPGGYVCPSHLECVEPAIYQHCALAANIDQCHGSADYGTCNYFNNSGAGFDGACRGGVCVQCQNAPDLDGCSVGKWIQMTAVTEDLDAVWVAGRGDAYAGGDAGGLYRYDGLTWSAVATLPFGVVGISGIDAMHVYLLDRNSGVFRYDGTSPVDITPPGGVVLNGIYAAAADSLFAVGQATILHYDGQSWTNMVSDATKYFWAVSGSSATNVLAVGNSGLVDHYDGTTWTVAPAQTARSLRAVWTSDAQHAFAVGTVTLNDTTPTIVQLAGGSWLGPPMEMLTSLPSVALFAVWGATPDNVVVAGDQGALYQYGGSWTAMPPLVAQPIKSISGSGASDVFAVGAGGTILHYSGN